MRYLERLFIEYLNAEGKVTIANSEFNRDQILSQLDPTAYDEAYNEWLSERKKTNLELADRILDLHDNRDRFEKLKEIYKRGQSVIPFIGAGLSVLSGYPSWTDFLCKVQKESGIDENHFNTLLQDGKYEDAAQLLHDTDSSYLQEQLENSYGKKAKIKTGIICRLPEFFKNTVVTTNYDPLIKQIYSDYECNFDEDLNGLEAHEYKKLLAENKKILLRLHGRILTAKKRILTKADYDRHYDQNNSIEDCLGALFSSTVLFLGCSLSVDRTLTCLEKITKSQQEPTKHYTFLSLVKEFDKDENPIYLSDDERVKRRQQLQKSSIYPIWYDGDHDECIEALLEKLAEE